MSAKILGIGGVAVALAAVGFFAMRGKMTQGPIKVGILHSKTGTMGISENTVIEAEKLAIDEINAAGGIKGRKIEAVEYDGKSDWNEFAKGAEQLITQDKVVTVFGCWTSASRRTVKPIFEKHNHLLFYPVQYEGLEQSPNIVYTGAAPNQQILPAVDWTFNELKKRKFFLVGSDYVFPRSANAIIKGKVAALNGEITGEEYVKLGSTDVQAIVDKIVALQPEVIFNTINGDTNVAFYKALRAAGITPEVIPSVSFSIAEPELQVMGTQEMTGDYAAWNYFQSVDTPENQKFIAAYRAKYGADKVVSDPMEAGYFGVYIWKKAVEKVLDSKAELTVDKIREAVKEVEFEAPGGLVSIDKENNHTWKPVRIGKIRADGMFDIVWQSSRAVEPVPYPVYRSREEWEQFLVDLHTGWGGNWANLGN